MNCNRSFVQVTDNIAPTPCFAHADHCPAKTCKSPIACYLHLCLLNVPFIPITLKSTPFRLQELKHAWEGVLGHCGLWRCK